MSICQFYIEFKIFYLTQITVHPSDIKRLKLNCKCSVSVPI